MSAETLRRIMDGTSARLAAARYGAETQEIGLDHMRKMGADLAEVTFTTFRAEPYTNEQINAGILNVLGEQDQAIVESFAAFGVTDDPFLDQCRDAATSGFLDRAEALFSTETVGGQA